jgi:hypothetical protein
MPPASTHNTAKGIAQLNRHKGMLNVRIKGLKDRSITDVWLVENQASKDRSVASEAGDRMVKAGTLKFDEDDAWLDALIDGLADIQVDLVVVAKRKGAPDSDGALVGTTSWFQKYSTTHNEPRSPGLNLQNNSLANTYRFRD